MALLMSFLLCMSMLPMSAFADPAPSPSQDSGAVAGKAAGDAGGQPTVDSETLSLLASDGGVRSVAIGYSGDIYNFPMFFAAVKGDGSLWTWGANFWGELGDGTREDRHSPVQIFSKTAASPVSLNNATIASIPAQAYTGKALRPAVTVKVGGKTLRNGTDYTVAYRNNVNVGTATVTVTGKGSYTGSKSATFRIVKPAASSTPADKPSAAKTSIVKAQVSLSQASYAYEGKAKRPGVTVKLGGKALMAGTDYTVSYKNNAGSPKAGSTSKATVTVTGKGKYAGSASKSFSIKNPSVQYYVHRQTYGWEKSYSKCDGQSSGTTGQKKRLEGIQVRPTGDMAKKYDVYYRVHAQKFGWMGWAKNGASAGTAGYAYRLESIQIKLVPKGAKAPTSAGGIGPTAGKAAFSQKK